MNTDRNKEHKNRIAFCIPTKNRYLCMKELLEYLEDKKDICPMDIFIYDSSDDDRTKKLAETFAYHGGKITYIDMNDYQGNIANQYSGGFAIKYYTILKDFVKPNLYDYLWVSGDGLRFFDAILETIYNAMDDYHLITLGFSERFCGKKREDQKVYGDAETYILENSNCNTLTGGTLINTRALKLLDFEKVLSWCTDEKLCCFAHVQVLAEIAKKAADFHALTVYYYNSIPTSVYKTDRGWRKNFFKVLMEGYEDTVRCLPISEGNKNKILDVMYSKNKMLDVTVLKMMRVWGVYNQECLGKYQDYVTITNDIPYEEAKEILDTPTEELSVWYEASKKRLDTLCRKHSKIMIYGAGMYAKIWYSILYNLNIEVAGFIVSDKDNNPSELMELPVRTLDEIKDDLKDTGIIIGIWKENAIGIKERLLQYVDENAIFFEEDWRMVAY